MAHRQLPGGILFTPGPLSTTATVKQAMMVDYGSRDVRFIEAVREVRTKVLQAGNAHTGGFTTVLMQGSGTMGIEAICGSVTPPNGKFLIIKNGAYGDRLHAICRRLKIDALCLEFAEDQVPVLPEVEEAMKKNPDITNVGIVHCETTSGILNPLHEIATLRRTYLPHATFFVDAMSSFGGVEIDIPQLGIDFLVTSSNKCIQGVPGFSLIIANIEKLKATSGWARGYSFDLLAQWEGLESSGQFRNTPPVHSIMAFQQALRELEQEGGVAKRSQRYRENRDTLIKGMKALGFKLYLSEDERLGWSIVTFLSPAEPNWDFQRFYTLLREKGFVIYPGKLTKTDCFRLGCIGDIHPSDVRELLEAITEVKGTMGLKLQF
eukprot:TRINITY_DN3939_c0_g1_i1.p2 TRINITY_DN3939_c0_g1~~TRINITY_DN3939_c0_g1_i1.p2  ORF type:complete len:385 (+),score=60.06 TRINITY_DN3939_c0_g1_i1:24-1157(+)